MHPAEKYRPRGRWLAEYGSAPTDPEAPPMPVGRGRNDPTEAERIALVGATKAACVDAAAAYVDVAGLRA